MRFLELHFEVTGEVPDPTPAMMERCGVCTEKSYLTHCAHCEKKVCTDCKEAHLDILKREITRINNQVRRGLNRLQDALSQSDKSTQQLKTNCQTILDEIEEIYRRLQKGLKDREEALKTEVLTFMQNELRSAETLKESLDTEVSNIESNSELVEKHVTENSEWDDVELMEYKDTFLRTLEFLRNFDPDQADFNRRLKFQLGPEPEAVHQQIVSVGELTISAPNFPGSCVTNTVGPLSGSNLMRSKSEHRLATSSQSQQRLDAGYLGFRERVSGHAGGHNSDNEGRDGRTSPLSRRRTGDLSETSHQLRRSLCERTRDYEDGNERSYRRYGREHAESRWQRDDDHSATSYRSRFSRDGGELQRDSSDGDVFGSRSVRFARQQQEQTTESTVRERVLETEDATRGPLSGICRLMDSPRVMERLSQVEQRQKQAKQPQPQPAPPPVVQTLPTIAPTPRVRTARQISEEDEIAKQKALNKKEAQTSTATQAQTAAQAVTESMARPTVRRLQSQTESDVVALRRPASRTSSREDSEVPRPPSRQTSNAAEPKDAADRSTTSSESSSKEEESPQPSGRRRFYNRASASSTITENKSSDSDSDAKTPTPQVSSGSASLARQNSLEDVTGQEKPNYFRYRTAHYSRSPSNSSVNLESQDETNRNGALSPTLTSSGQQYSKGKPTTAMSRGTAEDSTVKHDRSKSTDSSSSSASETSSTNSTGIMTGTSGNAVKVATLGSSITSDKKDDRASNVNARYGSFRNSADTESTLKDDSYGSVSANRLASLASTGRTSSLDKKQEVSGSVNASTTSTTRPRFVSRFLPRTSSLNREVSDSSDSDSDDDSKDKRPGRDVDGSSPISALLARSAIARRDNQPTASTGPSTARSTYAREREREEGSSRRPTSGSSYGHGRDDYKKEAADTIEGRYSSLANKYLTRSRPSLCDEESREEPKYGSSYAGRYLSKSKSSAALSFEKDDGEEPLRRSSLISSGSSDRYKVKGVGEGRYGSNSTAARRSRLGRSKSSHELIGGEEDDDDDHDGGYGFERPSDYVAMRSRSHHALDSPREASPDETTGSSALSSWARYLKSKYGNKSSSSSGSKDREPYQGLGRSRSSHALYSREASSESSDDETDLGTARTDSSISRSPGRAGQSSGGGGRPSGGENPRSAYLQKRRVLLKIGVRGSDRGNFTWPRGIAVGPDNSIVVADSSNHRVQVFDDRGSFLREFGTYGSAEGEFDCLAGVAVNRIGQYIISDRYNHRIQVFDPSGRFLRAFGSQGSTDGKLSYPWGIATDSLGFIYVCDKENHRIQVFQSDGTFVGKFGSLGDKPGQLEHPHYVAVSNTNKVVVSDSNNHRVQIFDVNGRVLSTIGGEGTDEGRFKFPRGVAVDDQGFIVVGDSGNNRIQVFQPDGTFLKAYGTWGSGEGEFKGLEGVAVTSDGNILVCDRENHRIQIF